MPNSEGPKTPSPESGSTLSPAERELVGLEHVLADFTKSFQGAARRWELLVYPALLVFGIMGVSGFYLIYSLTKDMHSLASYIDPLMAENMGKMAERITALSINIDSMTIEIERIATDIDQVSSHIATMDTSLGEVNDHMADISEKLNPMEPILANMIEMNRSMHGMTWSTGVMSRDMGQMNYNVGRPMSFMNKFMPW
jgi:methyl-accepting chemotaxis protein